jgi:HD-GYP domain-containing protein (c-di-GMP phosphodiesterase class II)
MEKKKVLLSECKPGDVIANTIIDVRTGVVLCNKGHVITRETLEWLGKFTCSDIYIAPNYWDESWQLAPDVEKKYNATTETLNTLLTELQQDKPINKKCLQDISTDFFSSLNVNSSIVSCINKVKSVDSYTYMHCMNTAMLAVLIGKWIRLPQEKLEKLFLAGLLCDIGKYKVPSSVLLKPQSLLPSEMEEAKKHVFYSLEVAKEINEVDEEVLQGIRTHHERMDGSGYPNGLKGEEIPLFGRILGIADTFDAMISDRVYKPKESPFFVIAAFTKDGYDKFDVPCLVPFLTNIAQYYIGVYVKLNTGQIGEVVFIHPHYLYKPIVKVNEDTYLDLAQLRHVYVQEVL